MATKDSAQDSTALKAHGVMGDETPGHKIKFAVLAKGVTGTLYLEGAALEAIQAGASELIITIE